MVGPIARKNLTAIGKRIQLVTDGAELLPGITIVAAYGHTPGQLALHIQSQEDELLYLADVALHPLHLIHPDWYASVDRYPDQTVNTRTHLLQRAAWNDIAVLLCHFDFPSIGKVTPAEQGWSWQPISAI